MLATATQIELKSLKGFFLLGIYLYRIRRQLVGFPGLVSIAYSPRFQTLSVWESEQAMKAFRNSGAHLEAMKATRKMGRATVITWTVTETPSWAEANQRLVGAKKQA